MNNPNNKCHHILYLIMVAQHLVAPGAAGQHSASSTNEQSQIAALTSIIGNEVGHNYQPKIEKMQAVLANENQVMIRHGVVKDYEMTPLEGVTVEGFVESYHRSFIKLLGPIPSLTEKMPWRTVSDSSGVFRAKGKGIKICVTNLVLDGYVVPPQTQTLHNDHTNRQGIALSTNLFTMWPAAMMQKHGVLKSGYCRESVTNGGVPVLLNLTTPGLVLYDSRDQHIDITFRITSNIASVVLYAPRGGFVLTEERYPFLAPSTGYTNQISFDYNIPGTPWLYFKDVSIYYRDEDAAIYGLVSVSVAASESGEAKLRIYTLANTNGLPILMPQL